MVEATSEKASCWRMPSYATKKKERSFLIGPPIVPPKLCCLRIEAGWGVSTPGIVWRAAMKLGRKNSIRIAMESVAASLGLNGDDTAGGVTEFGIVGGSNHLELFDGVHIRGER